MDMLQKLTGPELSLSCEYFPPRNPSGWSALYATLATAHETGLDFVSVTYGAGGSTRQKTISLVERIQNELNIDTIAHLTCAGHSRAELQAILSELQATGIPAVMALRGDPPRGSHDFVQYPDGFRYASELIDFIRRQYDFKIGCACYPEGHPESANVQQDIEYLKLKQECGADFAVTQLFFDNDTFFRFRDAARRAGVTIPIIAGLMPVTAVSQLTRFQSLCGCVIPFKLTDFLQGEANEDVVERGIAYGLKQAEELLEGGVEGIHLYTLNQSRSSTAIIAGLRANGRLTP
ncbi:MAG: methylenetetrahydrofolate reductase [NAD(P)H] [Chloroflexi bacterium]|nr:methylenetetrahydrofolate reductase [NAD(P)H] [Chloroflexota bacterium]